MEPQVSSIVSKYDKHIDSKGLISLMLLNPISAP